MLDDVTLRRYLLGELSEDESEALEEEYFDDPEVLARVRGAEDDLIDDYVAGRLSRRDRLSFERHQLATPGQRERLVAASALRMLAGDARAAPREGRERAREEPGPTGLWPRLVALAALLLLSVLAFRQWSPVRPERSAPPASMASVALSPAPTPPTPTPVETAALAPRPPVAFVIALAPLLTRGTGTAPDVRLPPGASEVRLEFQGEAGALPGGSRARLRASLATVEGREVWRGAAQSRVGPAPGPLASARLPAGLLRPDDYIATLFAQGAPDEAPLRYFFRVVE